MQLFVHTTLNLIISAPEQNFNHLLKIKSKTGNYSVQCTKNMLSSIKIQGEKGKNL